MKKIIFLNIIIFIFSLISASAYASGEKAKITNFIINKNKNTISLSFSTENAFSPEISDLIQSGIPVSFSFDIQIEKIRDYLPDKTIYEKEIIHKIKYSNLTKNFFIIKPYISEESYIINSKKRAQSEMSSITDFKIDLPHNLKGKFTIYARARLQEITLPFYMHKVFFFLSAWDFKTDWIEQEIEL